MAFEFFWQQLEARVLEHRDPGSADTYLSTSAAAEAVLKVVATCVLSEAAYHHGLDLAKALIAQIRDANGAGSWSMIGDVAGRCPKSTYGIAPRLLEPPPREAGIYEAMSGINALLEDQLSLGRFAVPKSVEKLRWRHAIQFLPFVRNKVKGHGAPPSRLYPQLNPFLIGMARAMYECLLQPLPPAAAFIRWLPGGNRGVFLKLTAPPAEVEQETSLERLEPGDIVLCCEDRCLPLVPFVLLDEATRSVLLFNDSCNAAANELEYLDYVTGHTSRHSATLITRHGYAELAPSETTAAPTLRGEPIPHNLPERRKEYVARPLLEAEVGKYLVDDLHRIVSLDGRGGVGKTYLANELCHEIAAGRLGQPKRFGSVVWMSARDIDLTAAGPVAVRQDLVTLDDVLGFVVKAHDENTPPEGRREAFVEICRAYRPLLIFDNFETFQNPEAVYRFLDETVPHPTKILITSRHRYFQGDYCISVGHMSEEEGFELIRREARARYLPVAFGTMQSIRRVYEAAQGHPYAMRLIVAHVARGQEVHDACESVRTSTEVLGALFERSLRLAEPRDLILAAILAMYRSDCPLEILQMLPFPPMETADAMRRLHGLSLVEELKPVLLLPSYRCPRAAGEYIRRSQLLAAPAIRSELERHTDQLRSNLKRLRAAQSIGSGTPPGVADVLLEMSRNALDEGEPETAQRCVDLALDLAPDDSRALAEGARITRRIGKEVVKVNSLFERALEADMTNVSVWLEWGQFKVHHQNQHGEGMFCFERALEADPLNLEAAKAFSGAVLEVVKREKKVGAGALRPGDRRAARTLVKQAADVLTKQLGRGRPPHVRSELLETLASLTFHLEGPQVALKIIRDAISCTHDEERQRSLRGMENYWERMAPNATPH